MHLSFSMRFDPICNFFEAIDKTIIDIVNNSWSDIPRVKSHRLKTLTDSTSIDRLILKGILSSLNEAVLQPLWGEIQIR